jgi:hypothetical protein
MKNVKTLFTFVGMIFSGRTALKRAKHARAEEDRLELLDAALNAAVVITGLLILIRRLREKDEPGEKAEPA